MTFVQRLAAAAAVLVVTGVALVGSDWLGPLRGPMLLVIGLPIMAHALSVIGWVPVVAEPFTRLRAGVPAIIGTYLAWLGLSALLTLDVAAVVAVPVGLAVARRHEHGGRMQVAGAVVGANVGSLLFPFSNLTNLVLMAGTGLAFATYVQLAWLPQLAAAVGAGVMLAVRSRTLSRDPEESAAVDPDAGMDEGAVLTEEEPEPTALGRAGAIAGSIAVGGAVATIAVGFAGGDVATVLTIAAAAITALALVDGRLDPGGIRRAISVPAVAVILAAAVLRVPIAGLAAYLPVPDAATPSWLALPAVALVGGGLSALVNNLPAAAFGAFWLHGADGQTIVAYLIGTNVLALATPHGSVATMLGRTLAHRGGVVIDPRTYLLRAWRYALAGSVAALAVLVVVR